MDDHIPDSKPRSRCTAEGPVEGDDQGRLCQAVVQGADKRGPEGSAVSSPSLFLEVWGEQR